MKRILSNKTIIKNNSLKNTIKIQGIEMKITASKKGVDFGFFHWWAEYFAIGALLTGLILSIIARSAFMSYGIITLCGLILGRMFYKKKDDLHIPFFIMTACFIIGFLIGSTLGYGDTRIIFALFIGAMIFSNWLHSQGYISE